MKQAIQLSDHFTYKKLFRFVMPTIFMMVFTSIYSVVDGLFVANKVGSNAMASISIVMPINMIIGAIGFMIGSGGNAIISKSLGEGKKEQANKYFTLFILVTVGVGVLLSAICIIFMRQLSYLMGASDLLIDDCVVYGRILIGGVTLFMLQTMFQAFFITAEKPHVGFVFTLASGLTNIVLDWLFVGVLNMGIAGAAIATDIGYAVGGLLPVFYFLKGKCIIKFGKPCFDGKALRECCGNGSSEFISNVSASVIQLLYNLQFMKYAGEDGVAAMTIVMYVNFLFIAIHIGLTMGVAPIIGYHYGAKNKDELKNVCKKTFIIVAVLSAAMLALSESCAGALTSLFARKGTDLYDMTVNGFRLYSISFAMCGFIIFSSAMFTALSNGIVSAVISFSRTVVFQIPFIFLLPLICQQLGAPPINGIWLAIVFAELFAIVIAVIFIFTNRKKYGY